MAINGYDLFESCGRNLPLVLFEKRVNYLFDWTHVLTINSKTPTMHHYEY